MPSYLDPNLHPRNPHREGYDFESLEKTFPALTPHLHPDPTGHRSIDFADPAAVLALNQALLVHYYHIHHYTLPTQYLCPAVPGRADYLHYLADLIGTEPNKTLLDIGTGANAIYPILGHQTYGWDFVGTDIDEQALQNAQHLITQTHLQLRHQPNPAHIFHHIIQPIDYFHATICNPPFFQTHQAALTRNQRRWKNLDVKQELQQTPSFSGQANELWCKGGEMGFLTKMIEESKTYAQQVGWFTTLVSRKHHLEQLEKQLVKIAVQEIKIIPMQQGLKQSRLLAWRYRGFGK